MAAESQALEPSKHTGRPTKLTPEVQKQFIETLKLTGNMRAAANRIGVTEKTVHDWKARGAAETRGIYSDFLKMVRRTLADRVALSAGIHFRVSHGEIYQAPKRKWLTTPRGDMIPTNEVETIKTDDGADIPVMVPCVQDIDLKAIQWELAVIDPDTYARRSVGVAINNQNSVEVRPLLVDVLKEIGNLPEDATRRALAAWDGGDDAIDVTPDDETRAALEAWKDGE